MTGKAAAPETAPPSKFRVWGARISMGLPTVFLIVDAFGKLVRPQPVIEGTVRLGFPESSVVPLGIVLAVCTALYIVRRTAVLGAILISGYLGGAVAAHVRIRDPLFSVVFPFIVGSLVWCGLWLRDQRIRDLLPLRR